MSDSVRMMDLVALSKNLDTLRRYDPESRAAAQRLAGAAAAHKVEEEHKDVEQSQQADKPRLRDHGSKKRGHDEDAPHQGDGDTEKQADSVPELDEGHLIDLKI